MRERMKLICGGKELHLHLQGNERISMLVSGRSRMGKTYFASCLGRDLIGQGESVHLIDLGNKWSAKDKGRLLSAGAELHQVEKEGIELIFAEDKEVCACGSIIANALGFRSGNAVMVIKRAIRRLLITDGQGLCIRELQESLETGGEEMDEENAWRVRVWERLDSCDGLPEIRFKVDRNREFSPGSVVWDLSGMDGTCVQVAAYLISFCLLCRQKRRFRNNAAGKKAFIIIDEFQTLDVDRRSIVGTCLAEGQKYGIALILITQFLRGNFSDAVISQFKQGGFCFYFRPTEEEAAIISRDLAGDSGVRRNLYKKLVQLPQGCCLMMGPHYIKDSGSVTEACRFVEIKDEQQA